MKTLRPYQWDAVLDLSAYASDGHKSLGLVAPTGSGKSLILAGLVSKTRPIFSGVVIAAPSIQIEENFKQDWYLQVDPHDIPWSSAAVAFTAREGEFLRLREEEHKQENFRSLLTGELDTPFLLTTHQQLACWGERTLPDDLTGKLLILDEGHHAGTSDSDRRLNTKIGDFGVAWESRGGTVLRTTATPFRSDGQEVFPEGTKTHIWTISDHAASGYAPGNFQIQTVLMDSVAETARQYAGEELSAQENNSGTAHRWLVDKWVADGKPKAVFIVPAKRSRRFTNRLLKALQAASPGVRVVDAVGVGRDVAERLQAALEVDKEVSRYEDSTTDVILACKRFDEGTDWPLCSHVYNMGIPRSFGLILQRWGRAFRNKSEIAGHPHPEDARITLFVQQVPDDVLAQFEKQHHNYAFLLACYMADWEVAREVRADLRIRMERSWSRPPRGEGDRVQRIRDRQRVEVPDHILLRMRARLTNWAGLYESRTGEAPNVGQLQGYLTSLSLSPVEHQAGLQLAGEFVGATRPALPIGEIREDYIAAWNEILADYRDQTYTEAARVLAVYSAFTGKDAKDVVGRLTAYFNKPNLTEDMIVEAAKRHHARTGRWPSSNTGDAAKDFGFRETWTAVHCALYEGLRGLPGGETFAQLLHRRGLQANLASRPGLTEELIVTAAKGFHNRTGKWPTETSGDASREFGFPVSWRGVAAALDRGFQSLPGGSTLPQLLHQRGLKFSQAVKPVDLTENDVVQASQNFHRENGVWPQAASGRADNHFNFSTSWGSVDIALKEGWWGLPGSSSLARLLHERGLKVNKIIKPSDLTEDAVVNAAIKFYRQFGQFPKTKMTDDAFPYIGFHTSWQGLNLAIARGKWGLPGGSSLARLLHDRGFKKNPRAKTPFVPANLDELADD